MRLTARQIECFRATVSAGGVSAAARLLNVAQPSVSRTLQDLELELGFALFERQGRRAVPTAKGLAFYDYVLLHFTGMSDIAAKARELQRSSDSHLRIGCLPSLSFSIMPQVLKRFFAEDSESRVSFVSRGSGSILEGVEAGSFDVGIGLQPTRFTQVDVVPLISDRIVCILPPGHPLEAKTVIRPEDLDGVEFIGWGDGSVFWSEIQAMLVRRNITPLQRMDTQRVFSTYAMVAGGLGVALLGSLSARGFGSPAVVTRDFEPSIPLDYYLFLPKDRPPGEATQRFCDTLRRELQVRQ